VGSKVVSAPTDWVVTVGKPRKGRCHKTGHGTDPNLVSPRRGVRWVCGGRRALADGDQAKEQGHQEAGCT